MSVWRVRRRGCGGGRRGRRSGSGGGLVRMRRVSVSE